MNFKEYIKYSDGKSTKSYKEYYSDYLNVLNESPVETGIDYDMLDNKLWNQEHTNQLLSDKNISNKGKISIFGIILDIYETIENNIHYVYFIDEKQKIIRGLIFFKEINNSGIEELSIFNTQTSRGIIRYLYLNWILKKYTYIMSDALHSTQARRFWEGLFFSLKDNKNYKFFAFNTINKIKNEINSLELLRKQYGNNFQHIRIILER